MGFGRILTLPPYQNLTRDTRSAGRPGPQRLRAQLQASDLSAPLVRRPCCGPGRPALRWSHVTFLYQANEEFCPAPTSSASLLSTRHHFLRPLIQASTSSASIGTSAI